MIETNSVRKLIDELLTDVAPEDAVRLQRVIAAIPPLDDVETFASLAAGTLRAVGRAEGGGSASRAAAAIEAARRTPVFVRRARASLRTVSARTGQLCACPFCCGAHLLQ